MTLTCACGAPAGTAPVVEDTSGPLCDRCLSRLAPPHIVARIDQGRAHARATPGQTEPDDETEAWLRSGLEFYFDLGHHDPLVPMNADDRFAFFAWLAQVDPDGWAQHRAVLLDETS